MKVRTILILSGLFVLALIGYDYFRRKQLVQDKNVLSTVLPSNDSEKIAIDPSGHKLLIITKSGTVTKFLPNRPSEIEVRKDGSVVVTASQIGVEHGLFGGGGFQSGNVRVAVGLDLLYLRKWDAGVFVSDEIKDLTKPRIGVILSYTVWHDTRLSVGLDNAGSPNVLITERF